jgi:hypothetical protein
VLEGAARTVEKINKWTGGGGGGGRRRVALLDCGEEEGGRLEDGKHDSLLKVTFV